MKINITFDTKNINPNTGSMRIKLIIDDEFEENGYLLAKKDLVKIIEEFGDTVEGLIRINLQRKTFDKLDDIHKFVKIYKENAEL